MVTATYNWSSVLRYAIRSVQSQDYPSWEMIVVGDACTDDSDAVVASFADERIRWHNRAENSGSQAIPNNDGIAMARGEYVAYLGHDDLWAPDHLSRLVSTALSENADVAFALIEVIGPPESGMRSLSGLTPDGNYRGGHLPPTGLLHRTAMAGEIGGWSDYRDVIAAPDVEFTERALAAGKVFAPTETLTAFKLPSVMRPNSYRDRRSDEQAALWARIRTERAFRTRELARILLSRLRHNRAEFEALVGVGAHDGENGSFVRAARRIRGLD